MRETSRDLAGFADNIAQNLQNLMVERQISRPLPEGKDVNSVPAPGSADQEAPSALAAPQLPASATDAAAMQLPSNQCGTLVPVTGTPAGTPAHADSAKQQAGPAAAEQLPASKAGDASSAPRKRTDSPTARPDEGTGMPGNLRRSSRLAKGSPPATMAAATDDNDSMTAALFTTPAEHLQFRMHTAMVNQVEAGRAGLTMLTKPLASW